MRGPGLEVWKRELAALGLALVAVASALGQWPNQGITPVNEPIPLPSFGQETPPISLGESYVSFLDSAVPMSRAQMRFDAAYGNRRPTRAEYFWAMTGPLSGRGPFLPETRVDYQELTSYFELALFQRRFSAFVEMPQRWVNPEINSNRYGLGDANLGCKWAFWAVPDWVTTLQLRAYVPTAADRILGTRHFSLEPALLLNYKPMDILIVEGEFRYWLPLGGTSYAGDVIRYGLGLVFGSKNAEGFWLTPVLEGVGWAPLNGQAMVAQSATSFGLQEAAGANIFNLHLGLRLGFGEHFDFYGGYGRPLTGSSWHHDIWRLECRFLF